jgi:putative redox protein
MMKASLNWKNQMSFECLNRHHVSTIDVPVEQGGVDLGPTPKELVLNAMMGCTAMDVISILKKMRQLPTTFEMDIEVEKSTEHPIHFTRALLNFYVAGEVSPDKLIKACEASLTKYCGVNYMISKSCEINYVVMLNNTEIYKAKAKF